MSRRRPRARSAAEREAGLTLAAIDYAQALATGAVDPRKLFEVYTVPMSKVDIAGGLGKAVEQGGVRQWLAGLAPQDAEYKALSDAYLAYRQKAGQERKAAIARRRADQARQEGSARRPDPRGAARQRLSRRRAGRQPARPTPKAKAPRPRPPRPPAATSTAPTWSPR